MNIRALGWSPWTCTNRILHGWDEGLLSGSSGKLSELGHDIDAQASIWPAAHHSPKVLCDSQAVSAQTDNGSISTGKLSRMTAVLCSLGKEGRQASASTHDCRLANGLHVRCECNAESGHNQEQTNQAAEGFFSPCGAPCSTNPDKTFLNAAFFYEGFHKAIKRSLSKHFLKVLLLNSVPWRAQKSTIKEKSRSKWKHCRTF